MNTSQFMVKSKSRLNLGDYKTNFTGNYGSKEEAAEKLEKNIEEMAELQGKLYAQNRESLLIVFQAMDGAGKDSVIKHVMTGLNPQSTQVTSFKQPSKEEMEHGFLWRINKAVPSKGTIGIFNRSHYEDVLIVRVHNLLKDQNIPERYKADDIWKQRYEQINNFEKYLYETGTNIIKFYLHISKDEQKRRFLKRIDDPSKNWKITEEDIKERKFWNSYEDCYREAIEATSHKHAPWYIIPGDKKWFAHLAVSEIIVKTLKEINPSYPQSDGEQKEKLEKVKEKLLNE